MASDWSLGHSVFSLDLTHHVTSLRPSWMTFPYLVSLSSRAFGPLIAERTHFLSFHILLFAAFDLAFLSLYHAVADTFPRYGLTFPSPPLYHRCYSSSTTTTSLYAVSPLFASLHLGSQCVIQHTFGGIRYFCEERWV